jgi:hypothetical protein
MHEVAAFEFGQSGLFSDETSLEYAAEEDKRGSRDVVGSAAGVLGVRRPNSLNLALPASTI